MKILYTILQTLTYNIYTEYESKYFLLTKLILNFCCHGSQKKLYIMENYHKKGLFGHTIQYVSTKFNQKVSMSSSQ